jgi:hypothetical protein
MVAQRLQKLHPLTKPGSDDPTLVVKATPVKARLAALGQDLVTRFCQHNNLPLPRFRPNIGNHRYATCGWYSNRTIAVQPDLCAGLGRGGPAWSWPGYIIDRTPYGVYAHELGHYVDHAVGGWRLAPRLRKATGAEKLTNYCPNHAEWFAELFRLFCTNPDLLRLLRPGVYQALQVEGLKPLPLPGWRVVLQDAPVRTVAMAARRIAETAGQADDANSSQPTIF